MKDSFVNLLTTHGIQPTLVDVGASGGPPTAWLPLAAFSTYLGFDPDQREFSISRHGRFKAEHRIAAIVGTGTAGAEVPFYLTKSPVCSSTLAPNHEALESYLFADLFAVQRQTATRTTTLEQALTDVGLAPRIDWLKLDTQGTDLRLLASLSATVGDQVLAVDVEPGLIHAYRDEDLFAPTHAYLMSNGYWLSRLRIGGAIRVRRQTVATVHASRAPWTRRLLEGTQRPSPGWCEARYLRTAEWLAEHEATAERYILLWVFSLLDEQYGFALDLAVAYRQRWGETPASTTLEQLPIQLMERARKKAWLARLARKGKSWLAQTLRSRRE